MNIDKISPDDPRLTTYALGEMEPAERAEFEQILQQDAAARAMVAEINGTARSIGTALANEPVPTFTAPLLPTAQSTAGQESKKHGGGLARLLRFPQMYFTISGLAAACFMVGFIIWEAGYRPSQPVHYTEVDVTKFTSAEAGKTKVATGSEPKQLVAAQAAANDAAESEPVLEVGLQPEMKERSEPDSGLAQASPKKAVDDLLAGLPVATNRAVVADMKGEATLSRVDQVLAKRSAPGLAATPAPAATGLIISDLPSSQGGKGISPMAFKAEEAQGRPKAKDTLAGTRQSAQLGVIGSAGPAEPLRFSGEVAGLAQNQMLKNEGNTEAYDRIADNPFFTVKSEPLSTFSIDVDTAAYANVRRFIQGGQRPPPDAVRIEELVNYFPYRYAPPETLATGRDLPGDRTPPFAAHLEVASAPWAPEHRLVRIGLKGREVSAAARPAANLVFLLDVSGSMNEPNKLPLVKESLRLLVDKLSPDDRVAIVVYAGASGLVLPSSSVAKKREIIDAIDSLQPVGSTNGALGIQLAYDIAKANFVAQGINRIVLCTDGDFNVGVTNRGELTRMVEEKAKSGVFLTVLGFGMGNYKDATLEQLADKGNGNYGYIDSRREAQKLLVEQAGGTLMTIAKDVKIQVEFNPAQVQAYRLIGYENRMLRKEDFNNDQIDAGEIGAGHTVTALYEVVPSGVPWTPESNVDGLKYQALEQASSSGGNVARAERKMAASDELLTLKLRYKEPEGEVSSKLEFPLHDSGRTFEQASADFKFAAAVAAFGMVLRDSPHKGEATFARVADWAQAGLVDDAGGYRAEFVGLVSQAGRLSQN